MSSSMPGTAPWRDRPLEARRGAGRGKPGEQGVAAHRRGAVWLIAVALVFAAVQCVVVTPRLPLGWDEAVFVSQVSPHVPTAYFSAPRARGISWLAAPVAVLTTSTAALRCYLSLLSAGGLVAGFWPWLRLVRGSVVAVAAAAFTSLWAVQFYGNAVMPNLYVGYGALAAVGWFLRACGRGGAPWRARAALGALAASVAGTALLRPPDAVYLAVALAGAAALVPAWRRLDAAAATLGGLLIGVLPWVIEGFLSYGGPLARLHRASEVEGHMGWHLAVGMQLRSLNGPMLCRPCDMPWHTPWLALWWLALPVLVAAGLVLAARAGQLGTLALPSACAAVLTVPYFFLIGYAAPRFLIPAYALLALPIGYLVVGAATRTPRRWRPVVTGLLACCLAGHLATQELVLTRRVDGQMRVRFAQQWLAGRLNGLGVRPPCVITGAQAPPLAFRAGCASEAISGNNTSITAADLLRRARSEPVAAASRTPVPPAYAQGWTHCPFTLPDGQRWYVFLAPSHRVSSVC